MKKYSNQQKVLQSRTSNNSLTYNDYDLQLSIGINIPDRTKAGSIIVKTDNLQNYMYGTFNYGENINKIKGSLNINTHTKTLNINEDDNGVGSGTNAQIVLAYYYLGNADAVKEVEISQSENGIQSVGFSLSDSFKSLISLSFQIQINSIDFSFLNANNFLKKLKFKTWTLGTLSNLASLTSSNVRWMQLKGYSPSAPLNNLIAALPEHFIYFTVTDWVTQSIDLKDYFTGNRHTLRLAINDVNKIFYTSKAFFPSVIQDEIGLESPEILNIALRTTNYAGNPNGARNLTPDENSKLLLDFANQVTAVNLINQSAKKITLYESANINYTDNSQPLFKTYASALNHITSTLGITVTFT